MTALLYRMIIATMAGEGDRLSELHDVYARESRLHVPIGEILREQQPHIYYPLAYYAAEDEAAKREVAAACYVEIEEQVSLAAAYLTEHLKRIARIMQEPPRPGRGGE